MNKILFVIAVALVGFLISEIFGLIDNVSVYI